ncbi:MAG TPA: polysaccharide ABC transporter ATP-binding protein [Pyrinomonadaceae bacterium]
MRPIIRVEGLSKRYRLGDLRPGYTTLREALADSVARPLRRLRRAGGGYDGRPAGETVWALRDVSFEVRPGEIVGVVGRNGAGKSTLLKMLSRIVEPTAGRYELYGRVGSLLEVGTGFHPDLSGRDNVFLNGAIIGMRRSEIERKFDEIVAFSEIGKFIDTPVKWYSSGMYLRLAFSVAAHLDSEILLMDEVLAVGDVAFQQKCLSKMHAVMQEGRTILFVSHSMQAVARLCRRVIMLEGGAVAHDGPAPQVVNAYLGTGATAAAERAWDDDERAPGNEVVRLRRVRVRDEVGRTSEAADIRRPIGIEVEYEVLEPGRVLVPVCHFYNREGLHIFAAQDNQPEWRRRPRPAGRYTSTAWVPGNFLSEGGMVVDVGVNSYIPAATSHFLAREAVGFSVVDSPGEDTARGDYTGEVPGVVRPLLNWTTLYDDGTRAAPAE